MSIQSGKMPRHGGGGRSKDYERESRLPSTADDSALVAQSLDSTGAHSQTYPTFFCDSPATYKPAPLPRVESATRP